MQIVAIILTVALVLKDVTIIGDRFLMRGFAQGLCLIMALWVPMNLKLDIITRYSIIFAYLIFLLTTNLSETAVVLQLISLAGVIFFFIAFMETQAPNTHDKFLSVALWSWFTVCLLSLACLFALPSVVYDIESDFTEEVRFRGLFSKPGMLGSAAGLMIGIAAFKTRGALKKYPPIIIGLLCLALTGSRTFWVALLAAMSLTLWLYKPKYRVLLVACLGVMVASLFLLLSGTISGGGFANKVLRVDSIVHLSGRTNLWEASIEAIKSSPYVGFGYTKGAEGLLSIGPRLWDYLPNMRQFPKEVIANFSLHNGYIQALMDSGYIGLTLYVTMILGALVKLILNDQERAHPLVFYGLIFSIITNFAETTMYAAAVFHSVLFWYFCIYAYRLHQETRDAKTPANATI